MTAICLILIVGVIVKVIIKIIIKVVIKVIVNSPPSDSLYIPVTHSYNLIPQPIPITYSYNLFL